MVYYHHRRFVYLSPTRDDFHITMATSKIDIDRYLAHALYVARRGGRHVRYNVGAVVVSNSGAPEPISVGWSHYSELNLSQYRTIHAEMHAIVRMHTTSRPENCTIYVATWRTRSRTIGLAKPCALCQTYLYEAGIRKIYFSDNNTYQYMELN